MKGAIRSAAALVSLLSVAPTCSAQVKGFDCNAYESTFFHLSDEARLKRFRDYDLETEFHLYLCGTRQMHPPLIELAEPIADKGSAARALLAEKLRDSTDDITVRDIVFIFRLMARRKTYEVAEDSTLMQLLNAKVASMKDDRWRQIVSTMISDISNVKR